MSSVTFFQQPLSFFMQILFFLAILVGRNTFAIGQQQVLQSKHDS